MQLRVVNDQKNCVCK